MKIALLLMGKHDHFEQTKDLLIKNIISGNDCDVYIHTWNIQNKLSPTGVFNPIKSIFEKNKKEFDIKINEFDPYVPPINTICQFYSFHECLKLTENKEYDFYIRCRFDNWFLNKINFYCSYSFF